MSNKWSNVTSLCTIQQMPKHSYQPMAASSTQRPHSVAAMSMQLGLTLAVLFPFRVPSTQQKTMKQLHQPLAMQSMRRRLPLTASGVRIAWTVPNMPKQTRQPLAPMSVQIVSGARSSRGWIHLQSRISRDKPSARTHQVTSPRPFRSSFLMEPETSIVFGAACPSYSSSKNGGDLSYSGMTAVSCAIPASGIGCLTPFCGR